MDVGATQAEHLDRLLADLLRAQLHGVDLFGGTTLDAADVTRWKQACNVTSAQSRWIDESLRQLTLAGHLKRLPQGWRVEREWSSADTDRAWGAWATVRDEPLDAGSAAQFQLLDGALRALPDLLAQRRRPTEVLFSGASTAQVSGVYASHPVADHFHRVLADSVAAYVGERRRLDPGVSLRILEIGAGTGGTTGAVLDAIAPHGEAIAEYCFTDISAAFLIEARERWSASHPFVTYRIFDVERPPRAADIDEGLFDVVIAANVLHATRNVRRTLRHAKAALRRNGWLFLNELCQGSLSMHLTFGLLDGWWLFEDDALRIPGSPLLTPSAWQQALRAEGFRQVLFPAADAQALGPQIILAESDGVLRREKVPRRATPSVALGAEQAKRPVPSAPGPSAARVATGHAPSDDVLLDSLRDVVRECLAEAVKLEERQIEDQRDFPAYGVDSIIAISLINKIGTRFGVTLPATIVFDHSNVSELGRYLLNSHRDAVLACHGGAISEPQAVPVPVPAAVSRNRPSETPLPRKAPPRTVAPVTATASVPHATPGHYLRALVSRPGTVDDLRVVEAPIAPLMPGEVRVASLALSLNFGDLLCARGLYPTMPSFPFTPGVEASGVVVEVASDVHDIRVGDEVVAMTGLAFGAHATMLVCHASLLWRKPPGLSHEEACALPAVAITMIDVFRRVGLRRGESVLIQTATGGTGLVAVQLAQHLGAEIYATAGSQAKLDYLAGLGVPHAINYLEQDFEAEISRLTGSRGVDVVINTLSGDALQKGLRSLAPGGRYVEIAMTGLKSAKSIDLSVLDSNQTFHSVDLGRLGLHDPERLRGDLADLDRWVREGVIRATVNEVFPFDRLVDAYRRLERRENIGKVVIAVGEAHRFTLPGAPAPAATAVDGDTIAVIGMSGAFPRSSDLDELWDHLANGRDLVEEVSRWDLDRYLPADADPAQFCRHGGFLQDIDRFDALFFNINAAEATYMDPQQRLLMTHAWQALEHAGYVGEGMDGARCGVYVGCAQGDYTGLFVDRPPPQSFWGNATSVIPARIAYYLNLQGPAIAVDTACSSSLVAIHLACQGLWRRETTMALAGGVFVQSTAAFYLQARGAGMLSLTGACHAFDSRADGFVPGEGVGVVALKRLDDARADGDTIHGVILGIGINQDGSTQGITAPSMVSQQRLERQVYDDFRIDPARIQYVEAHGTGTRLGDPIEFQALTEAFRKDTPKRGYCAIGSIKTSIGHTASAAGVAGVLKILLALRHRQLPPSLHFREGNPHIDFENSPFHVNTVLREWTVEPDERRCAAVSSFGISGTNAHAVIAEAPPSMRRHAERPAYLIVLSARTSEQLRAQVERLLAYCRDGEHAADIGDISFTLLMGRRHLRYRIACVAASREELVGSLSRWLEKGRSAQVVVGSIRPSELREQASIRRHGNECIRASRDGQARKSVVEHLSTVADLFLQGYALDYADLFAGGGYGRVPLPTYAFSDDRYWVPSGGQAIPPPAQRSLPAIKSSASYSLLMAPTWQPRAAGDDAVAAGHRVLMLGDGADAGLQQACETALRSHDVRCDRWVGNMTDVAAVYEEAAWYLLRYLDAVREERLSQPVLVQVLAGQDAGGWLEGLLPLMATACQEIPNLRVQWVAVEEAVDDGETLVARLLRDAASGDLHVRYRHGVRETRQLEPVEATREAMPWKPGGVYLVTGGLGGLGQLFASEILTRAPGARVVLAGRSALDQARSALLRDWAAEGHQVDYVAADVSRREDVELLVGHILDRHGALDGVIHAAGVLRDGFIATKGRDDLAAVMAAKVHGLMHLDEVLGARELDAFLVFSSTSAAFGNAGQADYAAANGFVECFARWRQRRVDRSERHGRTLSVGWPLWSEGGMRISAVQRQRLREEQGLVPLETADGMATLYRAWGQGESCVTVLRLLSGSAPRVGEPRSDAILSDLDPQRIATQTLRALTAVFSEVTQQPPGQIDATEPLESYGVDSLVITQLNARLSGVFGKLSATLFYEYATLGDVASFLVRDHFDACARWTGESAPVAPAVETGHQAAEAPPPIAQAPSASPAPRTAPAERAIAIVGLSGRYAGAADLDAFWDNLAAGRDSITEIPAERWSLEGFHEPDRERAIATGRSYSKWGGFLDGFAEFDSLFFNISPRGAMNLDPQERIFLQACWAAMEHAGYTRERFARAHDRRVGVFAGITRTGFELHGPALWERGEPVMPHTSFGSLANRVSYALNLQGPSMPVDTMCSSSLTAIHEACEHLLREDCEMAFAGGVNLYLHPSNYLLMSGHRMLSSSGRCHSFGADGDGFVPGEGVGVVLLKPLARAEADGDAIHGVIRATAINHDGKTNGYTVPNPLAQRDLIATALARAGIPARAVSYVEAHGTGTQLGDPIEITGLTQAFATDERQFCAIGSAKSNIGHCESAAGIAGLTKVLLQMRHGQLVPSLHAATTNPNIDFAATPFRVQRTLAEWPRPRLTVDGQERDYPRVAGISSFGAGGANAHVIVEEYVAAAVAPVTVTPSRPAVVVLSARTDQALRERAAQLLALGEREAWTDADLADVAYTLQVGREAMEHRLGFTAASMTALRASLQRFLAGEADADGQVLHHGEVKAHKDALAIFSADEELGEAVAKWLARGKHAKVLDLWTKGLAVDWRELHVGRSPRLRPLPTYPFARERHWLPLDALARPVAEAVATLHPLVHRNTSTLREQRFSSTFTGEEFFLADHRVHGSRVLPGVACFEMAIEAAALAWERDPRASGDATFVLKDVVWLHPLRVDVQTTVHVRLVPTDTEDLRFEIYTRAGNATDDADQTVHSRGTIAIASPRSHEFVDVAALRRGCDRDIDGTDCYALFNATGVRYGMGHRGICRLHLGVDARSSYVLAELRLPDAMHATDDGYLLHPGFLDSALQASIGLAMVTDAKRGDDAPAQAAMPFAADEIEVLAPTPRQGHALVRSRSIAGSSSSRLDVEVCDERGRPCVIVRGLTCRTVGSPSAETSATSATPETTLLAPQWDVVVQPFGESWPAADARVLVIDGSDGQGVALTARYGQRVIVDAKDTDASLTRAFASSATPYDHVVWIAPTISAPPGDDALIHAQQDGVVALYRLVKALLAEGYGTRRLGWTVLTTQSQRAWAGDAIDPAHASVHGFIGSVAKEYPHWLLRLVDLGADGHVVPEDVLRLPSIASGDAWLTRGGEWFRQRWLPFEPRPEPRPVFRRGGVHVVVGGAGGLGQVFTEYLLREHAASVVWIGRRAQDAQIEAAIERLRAHGEPPLYIQADATQYDELNRARSAIVQRYGRIHGIVHSAIVLLDKSLANMDEDRFRAALRAKVDISVRMAQVFAVDEPEVVLFFSALQSFVKAAGQSNYAAGCTFKDAFAHALQSSWPSSVKTMNWGFWGSVGSVSSEDYAQRMRQMGIGSIEPEEGIHGLLSLLDADVPQLAMVKTLSTETLGALSANMGLRALPRSPHVDDRIADTPMVAAGGPASEDEGANAWHATFHDLQLALLSTQLAQLGLLDAASETLLHDRIASAGIRGNHVRWVRHSLRILDETPIQTGGDDSWTAWRSLKDASHDDHSLVAQMDLVERALRALPDVLTGRRLATDVLFPDSSMGSVASVYARNAVADHFNSVLCDALEAQLRDRLDRDPGRRFRILEIGAGTGGTSAMVFERLKPFEAAIEEYTYTDVSRSFLLHAEDHFAHVPYLRGRLFNVEQAPDAQSMATGGYDVVIATNVLHATRNIRGTLRNAKATLKRGGLLLINEITGFSLFTHLTFGLLDGWWLFEDDALRIPGTPGLAPSAWRNVLRAEGFPIVHLPAEASHALGQQVIVALSDGVIFRTLDAPVTAMPAERRPARTQSVAETATVSALVRTADTARDDDARKDAWVRRTIVETIAAALRVSPDLVDPDEPFADYGLDSILGVHAVHVLSDTLGIALNTTSLFDFSTVNRLTGFILAEHEVRWQPDATNDGDAAATVVVGEPSSPTSTRFAAPESIVEEHAAAIAPGVPEPIAIVGLSARYPHAEDADALWKHLAQGNDLLDPIQGSPYGRRGVVSGIEQFDAMFFNISGTEATYMDPQQRLFLEEAWNALEDAGYAGVDIQQKLCGVYLGCTGGDYGALLSGNVPPQAFWGNSGSVTPSRIAYFLDLQGPALAIDTACSSSLVAIHVASQGLRAREVDIALAGGVFIQSSPTFQVSAMRAGMLSASGRCHTFDDRADGFVSSEGVGVVVLRRLADALASNDHIHGVIRGSGINQDGTTNGITAPSARSQERLHRQVYDTFDIDPADIQMVEAHGTGTKLGDPVEFQALTKAFRKYTQDRQYCAIGSIKTNLGHAANAAGVAGVIKVLLALRHDAMPASLHFEKGNGHIDFASSPFFVNTTLRPWPPKPDRKRLAAISSFGFSGTNAHLVIEEAPVRARAAVTRPAQLVVLSARSAAQLRAQAQRLLERLATWRAEDRGHALADVSHTLLTGRRHFAHRLACVSEDIAGLGRQLADWLAGEAGAVRAGEIRERGVTERGPHGAEGEACLAACATLPVTDATAYRQRLERLAELFVQGEPLDYGRLFAGAGYARVPLPTYPFARSRYWVPSAPAPATEATVPTGYDGKDETLHEAAPAFPLSGALTLVPGWAPIATGEVPVAGPRHDGTGWAILDDDPARQARWRARYPAAAVLTAAAVPARRAALAGIAQWFWMLPSAREPATGAAIVAGQAAGVMTGLALLQAFAAASSPLSLTVLTRRSQPVLAGEAIDPTHASVWGLLGSAAKEHPAWRLRLFDLEDEADEADAAPTSLEACLAWPADADGNGRAQRDGRWYRPVCVPCALPEASAPAFRPGGVYVIVGGAGELGQVLSEHLVRQYGARVVWLGRRAEDATIQARRTRLAAWGQAPTYLSVDARDVAAMGRAREAILARHGVIHGVVHATLAMGGSDLAHMGVERFEAGLSAKVAATVGVVEAFAGHVTDAMVFFSSIQALEKTRRQSNYAAGSTFLDAYVASRAATLGCAVRVIDWGYWASTATAGALESFRHWLAEAGMDTIAPAEGLAVLERVLASPLERVAYLRTTRAGALQGVRLGTGQVTVDAAAPPLAAALADFVPPAYAGPAPTAATQARAQALHALLLEVLVQRLREVGPATPCASLAAWKAGAAIAPAYTRWWAQTERLLRAHWGDEAAVLAAVQGPADATVAPRWAAWVAAGGEDAASLALVDATQAALPAILRGAQAATAVVFPQATLQRVEGMYRGNPLTDHCNAVVAQALVHYLRARLAQDPATRLRVLEVGAGTGGTSAVVFAALGAYAAHVAEYAYTDLSKAFLHHAQAQYAPHVPYLRGQVFDLEKAPAAQGVDAHGYDVVIATNVIHATRDIRQALGHVKAVLKGQGILLLNELSSNSVLGHLTFGLLEGWWRFEDAALREAGSPLLAPARWARALHAEGYAPVRFLTPELHAGTQVIAAVSDGVVLRADAAAASEPMTTSMEPSMKTPDTAPGADLALAPAPAPANTARLQAHVRQVVLETLSEALMVEMAAIHPDESFAEYGLDSLLGVRTVEAINATLGTTLSSTSVFDFSTVNKLTAHLVQRYRDTLAAALDGATAATATDAPAPTAATATTPAPTATKTTAPVALPSALAPIAIVGLSGRYPRSPDVATLWAHLAAGDDLTEPVTRWDMPAILGDTPYCPRGGFLDGIAHFDALFFNISGLEATHMDPQQRLFLEEAWKALEEAGHVGASIAGQRCGVYAGYNGGDYHLLPAGPLPAQAMWGKATSLVSARIAYHLDLQGPAITVDTACSSSLVAMHLACQALRVGEVDLALAGGVFVQSTPGLYLGGERAGMLSASGRCHTFDDRADGFVPGEGVGVVVLKRLDDALADGDHLHGVIRGSGINQDGATNGITAPSAVSQERLEREVYERFGIDADGIQLVEAHGTGTKLGDPIEFHALTRAFRQDSARQGYCAIGSIKTNLGHTTAASGVAGVLKVLLCLRHAQIAPSLHYDRANRHIDFADSPFYLPTALRPWTVAPGQVRRAAVSSFGLSGTNAHLVIEQAPAHARTPAPRPGYLWALSARSQAQLRQQVERLLAHLADEPGIDCGNVSYTLLMGRKHFEHRLACVGRSRDELVQRLGKWLERGKAPQVHVSRGMELQGGGEVALRRYGEQCMAECLPTLATDDYLERLAAIAELHVQGYDLDFAPLFASQPHARLSLPTYPFAPTPYWVEAPEATASVGARYVREHLHPLLHVNRSDFWQQRYASTFTGDEHEFTDHRVQGKRLLPGVAYLEMVHAATSRSMGLQGIGEGRHGPSRHEDTVPMVLRHVVWLRPIVVDGAPVAVSTTVVENDAGEIEFEIVSDNPDDGRPWVHAQGRAVLAAHLDDALLENRGRLDLERLRAGCERRVAVEDCYAIYASVGIEYGPAHRGLTRIDIGRDDEGPYVVAEVALPACTLDAQSRYALHPSIMDAAAQAALAVELADANASAQEPRGPVVPFALKEAVITQRTPEHAVVVIRADTSDVAKPGMRNLRIDICDTAGRLCVRLDGLRSRELTPPSHDADDTNRTERDAPGTLLTPSWEVDASPGLDGDRHQALLLLGEPATHGVRDALRQRHSHARLINVEPGATVEDIATALDGQTPGHVVWVATPTAFAAHPDEPSACAVACFRTIKALLHRGLGDDALEFTLVTTGACAVDADAPVDAAQAATHGLVGSLAKEYAHWTVRIVDIAADDPRPFNDMLDRPVDGHGRTSAHRDGEWLTQELIACEVEAQGNAYREGGVYVIVGGAGGIGEALSEHLIRRYRAHVVWLGRRAHDAGIAARIDRLVALGGPAPIYIQADATRRSDLERAYRQIRERHDEIHGIVHSAIVLLDKGLANMDEERFLAGLGAKVDASVRLAEVFADEPLDFAVFFSSFQSFARAGGQGNYASGCTFQDALAHELSRTWPCRVRVMNWGYWGSVGIVASEDIQRRMADLGVASIEPEEGLAALDRLLGGPFTQLAFVKTHLDAAATDEPPPQLVTLPDDTPSIDMGMLFS